MPEFIEIPPDPSNEIQMLSKIGYTLETALSDIIDNSISAGAKNIEILSLPKEDIFWSVIDDGIGMDSSVGIIRNSVVVRAIFQSSGYWRSHDSTCSSPSVASKSADVDGTTRHEGGASRRMMSTESSVLL